MQAMEGKITARRLKWPGHLMGLHPETPARKALEGEPWSEIIRARRLPWLGHLMQLHPETPARKALEGEPLLLLKPRSEIIIIKAKYIIIIKAT